MKNIKIVYSQELINNVKNLAKEVSSSTDKNLEAHQIRWYLSPQAHIARIESILTNEQIRQNTQKNCHILEIGSGIGTCCVIMKLLTGAEVVGAEPAPESYKKLHDCIKSFKACNPQAEYVALNQGVGIKGGGILS